MEQVARGLSQFNKAFEGLTSQATADIASGGSNVAEEQMALAEEDRKTEAQLIEEGVLSKAESRWYRARLNTLKGSELSQNILPDFYAEHADELADLTDLDQFDALLSDYTKQRLQEAGGDELSPNFLKGFLPSYTSYRAGARNNFVSKAGQKIESETKEVYGAEVTGKVRNILENEELTDEERVAALNNLQAEHDALVNSPEFEGNKKVFNKQFAASVISAYEVAGDAEGLEEAFRTLRTGPVEQGDARGFLIDRYSAEVLEAQNRIYLTENRAESAAERKIEKIETEEANQLLSDALVAADAALDGTGPPLNLSDQIERARELNRPTTVKNLIDLQNGYDNEGSAMPDPQFQGYERSIALKAAGAEGYVTMSTVLDLYGTGQISRKQKDKLVADIKERDLNGGDGLYSDDPQLDLGRREIERHFGRNQYGQYDSLELGGLADAAKDVFEAQYTDWLNTDEGQNASHEDRVAMKNWLKLESLSGIHPDALTIIDAVAEGGETYRLPAGRSFDDLRAIVKNRDGSRTAVPADRREAPDGAEYAGDEPPVTSGEHEVRQVETLLNDEQSFDNWPKPVQSYVPAEVFSDEFADRYGLRDEDDPIRFWVQREYARHENLRNN